VRFDDVYLSASEWSYSRETKILTYNVTASPPYNSHTFVAFDLKSANLNEVGSIGGTVTYDGARGRARTGADNVRIEVYDSGGPLDFTTTGGDGSYSFYPVSSGFVGQVKVIAPPGHIVNGSESILVTVRAGENVVANFDLIPSAPVGGHVITVNKLSVLSPYLIMIVVMGITSTVIIVRRKRQSQVKVLCHHPEAP
jgi:hypothetical protein